MKFIKILIVSFCLLWAGDSSAWFKHGNAQSNPNLRQENFFGLTGAAWQNPVTYYVPGTGNPAISTADYYHSDGAYWLRPYDLLDSTCGATGISIAASRGRYVWMMSPDHSDGSPWTDGSSLMIGYSNDPGVPPATMTPFYQRYLITALAQIATVTASIGNGVGGAGNSLIVTGISGAISVNSNSVVTGSGVTQATITAQPSGTPSGIGTYTIDGAAQNVASQTMTISQNNFSIGATPYLVCNPDDGSFPFYVYSEGSGSSTGLETGLTKSADLITWSAAVPAFVSYNFSGFAGYMRVVRTGVNTWYSTGFTGNFPQSGFGYGYGKWTSTDGLRWSPPSPSLMNACIPANSGGITGNQPCTQATATFSNEAGVPPVVTIGAQDWAMTHTNTMVSSVRIGNQWVSRSPIDANLNVISSPSIVNISAPYAGLYPGPTYVNATSGYVEDGVAHYYANTGFPRGGTPGLGVAAGATYLNNGACLSVAPARGQNGYFSVTGDISGTTLNVSALLVNSVVVGGQISGGTINNSTKITGQLTGPAGGIGTYTVDISQTAASTTITGAACGGLEEQSVDYYTEIINSSAAATAAPIGVKASCASSVASLTWFNSLPQQTYRLYRGTTAGSQTTLVGDFTGTTATDSGMTLNSITYYKLVYLHSGVEQKNRVVNTWCSSDSAFVNAHYTRASAGGADMTTCNRTMINAFDTWLVSNNLSNNLLFATMPDFCVVKSGSVITKIFDMGTTRLPRGGDYTAGTANTTYNATGISSKPAWVNGTNTSYGYYGSGRLNNIRRKTQITMFAAYQKPGTAIANFFISGQFSNQMTLSHTAGSPGGAEFRLYDQTQTKTATATFSSATAFNTIAGTFDGTTLLTYANAVVGSGQTGLVIPGPNLVPTTDALTGQIDPNPSISSNFNVIMSGTDAGLYNNTTGYYPNGNAALYSGRAQMIFDKALTQGQITSLDALVR